MADDNTKNLEERIKALEEGEGIDVNERIKTCRAISESNSKWYRHQGIVTISILALIVTLFTGAGYFVGKDFIERTVFKSIEGKTQSMINEYKEVLEVRIANMENRIEFNYWYKTGEKEFESKDYASAVKSFTKAQEKNPNHVYAVGVRGIAYSRFAKYKKAIKDLDKAINIKKDYAQAYYAKGISLFHLEEYTDAFKVFNTAVNLFIKQANYDEASKSISTMKSALDGAERYKRYNDEKIKLIRGDIEQLEKRLEEAKKESKETIK